MEGQPGPPFYAEPRGSPSALAGGHNGGPCDRHHDEERQGCVQRRAGAVRSPRPRRHRSPSPRPRRRCSAALAPVRRHVAHQNRGAYAPRVSSWEAGDDDDGHDVQTLGPALRDYRSPSPLWTDHSNERRGSAARQRGIAPRVECPWTPPRVEAEQAYRGAYRAHVYRARRYDSTADARLQARHSPARQVVPLSSGDGAAVLSSCPLLGVAR